MFAQKSRARWPSRQVLTTSRAEEDEFLSRDRAGLSVPFSNSRLNTSRPSVASHPACGFCGESGFCRSLSSIVIAFWQNSKKTTCIKAERFYLHCGHVRWSRRKLSIRVNSFGATAGIGEMMNRGCPAWRDRMAAWLRWILGSITPPISPRLPA
jgi:hypothetical protein